MGAFSQAEPRKEPSPGDLPGGNPPLYHPDELDLNLGPANNRKSGKGARWKHHGDAFTAALARALAERGKTVKHFYGQDRTILAAREDVVNTFFVAEMRKQWRQMSKAEMVKAWKETRDWALQMKVARSIVDNEENYLGNYE